MGVKEILRMYPNLSRRSASISVVLHPSEAAASVMDAGASEIIFRNDSSAGVMWILPS